MHPHPQVKRGFPAPVVLAQLMKQTLLEQRFSVNMVALVGGAPQTLTLRELLSHFLDFRCVRRPAPPSQLHPVALRRRVIALANCCAI